MLGRCIYIQLSVLRCVVGAGYSRRCLSLVVIAPCLLGAFGRILNCLDTGYPSLLKIRVGSGKKG